MIKLGKERTTPLILVVAYLLIIIYITLLSRSSSLLRSCKLEPFWSYVDWLKGCAVWNGQILFNIALFVPLGYFLFNTLQNWKTRKAGALSVVIGFLLSVAIEIMQYFTGLGTCDVDDVIHNVLGTCLGVVIYKVIVFCCSVERLKWWNLSLSVLFLIAGAVGCKMAYNIGQSQPYGTVSQFDFDISHAVSDSKTVSLQGYCHAYDRDTPDYKIWLRGEQTGKLYKGNTTVNGIAFSVSVPVDTEEEYEVLVDFQGYGTMSTFTYINDNRIEYVSGMVVAPDIHGTELGKIVQSGVLKAYVPGYDVYIYQFNRRLYWLIGTPIDKRTEIIFHLSTNEPDKLPEHRKKYKFDNRGFRVGGNNELTTTMRCGKYRVFERVLPSEYNIAAVTVGFNTDRKITWTRSFRVEK